MSTPTPSTLKIADLRVATVRKPGPSPCTIIRLDTNQGVYGLGEVRDGARATYALFLKSRVVDKLGFVCTSSSRTSLRVDSHCAPTLRGS
jgi:L-alanine-DL-glutamate epimerase-like enolase superfamily enzyme